MGNVEVRDGVGLVPVGDTLIAFWKAPPTLDRWRFQLNRMEMLAASRPDGIVCVALITEWATPPDAKVRQAMQADYRRMGTKVRRLVVIPLGDSIWLSIVRPIVRGVLMLGGHAQRHRVVATIQEGLEAVRAVAGPTTPSSHELREALSGLSAVLGVALSVAA
ncbi:MAG TPA: hypothetical protein VK841_02270 [Polyangiaceae bacterium]|nr:hypothetical protein [Polyangiaceae bacterium]